MLKEIQENCLNTVVKEDEVNIMLHYVSGSLLVGQDTKVGFRAIFSGSILCA